MRTTNAPTTAHNCNFCSARRRALCGVLNNEGLEDFKARTTRIHLETGDQLFNQNDIAENLYIIVSGYTKIYKSLADGRRQIIGFMMQGDTIGANNSGFYTYSAHALTAANLCKLAVKDLPYLQRTYPETTIRLMHQAQERVEQTEEHMMRLGRKNAKEKLAGFLLELSDRRIKCISGGVSESARVAIPMTRADIADYLGLTTESISRTFTKLKNEGIIQVEGQHSVLIHSIQALQDIEQGA